MNDDRKTRSGMLAAICVAMLLLPALYVASIGPVAYLVTTERIAVSQYISAYAPLIWLGERSDKFNDCASWYVGLWIDEDYIRQRNF